MNTEQLAIIQNRTALEWWELFENISAQAVFVNMYYNDNSTLLLKNIIYCIGQLAKGVHILPPFDIVMPEGVYWQLNGNVLGLNGEAGNIIFEIDAIKRVIGGDIVPVKNSDFWHYGNHFLFYSNGKPVGVLKYD